MNNTCVTKNPETQLTYETPKVLGLAASAKAANPGSFRERDRVHVLRPVLQSLPVGGAVELIWKIRPATRSPFTFSVRLSQPVAATVSLEAAAAQISEELRFALSAERSGCLYELGAAEENPPLPDILRVRPRGLSLPCRDTRARRDDGVWTLDRKLVRLPAWAVRPIAMPLAELLCSPQAVDVSIRLARAELAPGELERIQEVLDHLVDFPVDAAGDMDLGAVRLEPLRSYYCRSLLKAWRRRPAGYRLELSIASAGELPAALVRRVSSSVWGNTETDLIRGEDVPSPGILSLEDCLHESSPFLPDLPAAAVLAAAGLPAIWAAARKSGSPDGALIGTCGDTDVRMSATDRARHLYILGGTGTGKSTLMRQLIRQDIEGGKGVFLLDPHGDLVDEVLCDIPEARLPDLVLLDAANRDYPFSINYLDRGASDPDEASSKAVSELLAIFHRLYGDIPEALGPMFEQYFTIGLKLLFSSDLISQPTLLDLVRVFSDDKFNLALRKSCTNPAVSDVMALSMKAQGDATWANIAPYITCKLNRITLNPLLRNLLCQQKSTVDFRSLMDSGRIVLVRLPKGSVPELDVKFLGMVILSQLFSAALGRADLAPAERRGFNVYVDEFQNFMTETTGHMLAEGRKYGLSLTLANQNLAQLPSELRQTMLSNASSLLAFRMGPDDARAVAPFFDPGPDVGFLQKLPNFVCAARLLNSGVPDSTACTVTTVPALPAARSSDQAARVACEASRRSGRAKGDVVRALQDEQRVCRQLAESRPPVPVRPA
ncbi:DUF87 domain-containing protein [Hyphomonas sp.]|uniref:type IV secretory system conjugative DNA transfer family protein n=1 Tax=Hyphomonas sp. TaxID=87 RepID=UPI0025BB5DD6|nr:DUF87 domain-containing protein [Hyphomonas sp.]